MSALEKAKTLVADGRYKEAVDLLFKNARQLDPSFDEKKQIYEALLKLCLDNYPLSFQLDILWEYGEFLRANKNYDQALRIFGELVERSQSLNFIKNKKRVIETLMELSFRTGNIALAKKWKKKLFDYCLQRKLLEELKSLISNGEEAQEELVLDYFKLALFDGDADGANQFGDTLLSSNELQPFNHNTFLVEQRFYGSLLGHLEKENAKDFIPLVYNKFILKRFIKNAWVENFILSYKRKYSYEVIKAIEKTIIEILLLDRSPSWGICYIALWYVIIGDCDALSFISAWAAKQNLSIQFPFDESWESLQSKAGQKNEQYQTQFLPENSADEDLFALNGRNVERRESEVKTLERYVLFWHKKTNSENWQWAYDRLLQLAPDSSIIQKFSQNDSQEEESITVEEKMKELGIECIGHEDLNQWNWDWAEREFIHKLKAGMWEESSFRELKDYVGVFFSMAFFDLCTHLLLEMEKKISDNNITEKLDALYLKISVLREQHKIREALDCLEQIKYDFPLNKEEELTFVYLEGELLELINDKQGALACYKHVERIERNYRLTVLKIQRLSNREPPL